VDADGVAAAAEAAAEAGAVLVAAIEAAPGAASGAALAGAVEAEAQRRAIFERALRIAEAREALRAPAVVAEEKEEKEGSGVSSEYLDPNMGAFLQMMSSKK
jgi:hypothetical protein